MQSVRWRLFPIVAAVLAAVALAGCGVQPDHTADATEGDEQATLPTLPPAEERLDGLYDSQGCLILSDGPPDCSASADVLDEALAGGSAGDPRTLAGFQGPLFVTDLSAGVVAVLEDTVAAATSGPWRASGLLRNETTSPVIAPTATATLRSVDGGVLDQVSAVALVAPVRPGEPAPFNVESDVDAGEVASVDWIAADAGGEAPLGTRDLGLATYFTRPAGDREPLDVGLYRETGPGPHPFVLFGSITNLAGVQAPDPTVVGVWLGQDGRVQAVGRSAAERLDGTQEPLAEDEIADFVLTVAGSPAVGLESAQLLLWAVSR